MAPLALFPGQVGVLHREDAAVLRVLPGDGEVVGGVDAGPHRPHVVHGGGVDPPPVSHYRLGGEVQGDGLGASGGAVAVVNAVGQGLPHPVLIHRQGGAPEVQPPLVVGLDLQHRPPGVVQRPRVGQIRLLRRADEGDGVVEGAALPPGEPVRHAVGEAGQAFLRLPGPGGAGVALPGEGQGDPRQQQEGGGEAYKCQPPPGGGRGPAAQGGEEQGAPAGAQGQEGGPAGVQVRQQAGEKGGQGEQGRQPPTPPPGHRPAQGQGQPRQGQDQEQPDSGPLLQGGEARFKGKGHPPVHPLGKQPGHRLRRETGPGGYGAPAPPEGQPPQGGKRTRRRPPEAGQAPHAQGEEGEQRGPQQELVPLVRRPVQGDQGDGGGGAVQGQEGGRQPQQGAQQHQPVPQDGGGGGAVFPFRHGCPLLPRR